MTDSNSDVTGFHDRVVLITGGTSGMGLATARPLLEAGAHIVITGRDDARLDRAAEQSDTAFDRGGRPSTVRADSASLTDLDRLAALIRERHGRLDGVFANAGVGVFQRSGEVTEQDFDLSVDVNFKGRSSRSRRFCRRSLPHLEDVALPAGGRRRVAGPRREEIAQLAGVSVDYCTRMEQGRVPNPSGAVLDALARALRLDGDATRHLHRLAGPQSAARHVPRRPTRPQHVRPVLQRLRADLPGSPGLAAGDPHLCQTHHRSPRRVQQTTGRSDPLLPIGPPVMPVAPARPPAIPNRWALAARSTPEGFPEPTT
ncbi:SDR family NAD(P)-dependent oxidoreductase [Streptomyces sp. NPDC048577]|uniref:SDR family NAD(P)-dependent oxidoreductase n=1 Tax=Streptomyces sp. NPDC048577 TaxID=3157209 RepID=UPI0034328B4D